MKGKTRMIISVLALCILAGVAVWFLSARSTVYIQPNTISVGVLKESLPSDEGKRQEFLVRVFFKQEHSFESYTVENWKSYFTAFASILIQKAQHQKLDSASLRSILDLTLKDAAERIAYLPFAAYQSKLDGKPVWIVVMKWEYPMDIPSRPGQPLQLIHIRAAAYDQKTLERVGFMTCN